MMGVSIWITDSSARILPRGNAGTARALKLAGARGQVVSFQVGVKPGRVVRKVDVSLRGELKKHATARLAGLVPLRHHTENTPAQMLEGDALGFVPDPLVAIEGEALDAEVSRSIWVTVRLPGRAMSGKLTVAVCFDGESAGTVQAEIQVWDIELPELKLPVTNWFYSDAICDWYEVSPFSGPYWAWVEQYFKNLVDHNQTAIYTPLFTPPLDGEKRFIQLVDVAEAGKGRYRFGWGKVKQWIKLAREAGFRYFEMSHLFSQWGAAHAIRILVMRDGVARLLCEAGTAATGKVYYGFLEQFLPALVRFLKREGIFERCIFHLSDEPGDKHVAQYRAVREMVREIAPEIRNTEALSHVQFFKEGLIDVPVPVIDKVPDFLAAGIKPWVYYCCNPQGVYPNRFLDYPLYRLRILGAMLYLWDLQGFLHWGCNYWYRGGTTKLIDPYQVTDAQRWPNWTAGDPFIIYPGKDGPVDSLRWEVFRETMDDYRLLKLAQERVGRERVVELLREIKSPADYPRESGFMLKVRLAAAALAGVTLTGGP